VFKNAPSILHDFKVLFNPNFVGSPKHRYKLEVSMLDLEGDVPAMSHDDEDKMYLDNMYLIIYDNTTLDANDKQISSKPGAFINESVVNSTTMKEGVRFKAHVKLPLGQSYFTVEYADTQPNKVQRVIYYFSGWSVLERFLVDGTGGVLPWSMERGPMIHDFRLVNFFLSLGIFFLFSLPLFVYYRRLKKRLKPALEGAPSRAFTGNESNGEDSLVAVNPGADGSPGSSVRLSADEKRKFIRLIPMEFILHLVVALFFTFNAAIFIGVNDSSGLSRMNILLIGFQTIIFNSFVLKLKKSRVRQFDRGLYSRFVLVMFLLSFGSILFSFLPFYLL